jgi:hypothetical protein
MGNWIISLRKNCCLFKPHAEEYDDRCTVGTTLTAIHTRLIVLNLVEPKLIAMRRASYGAILLGVLLTSCAKTGSKKASCINDTISVFAAYRMIHHYGDTTVGHGLSDIIRHFRIDNNCLSALMIAADETTFWTGADTITHMPLIIIETKQSGNPPHWFAMKGIPLCPPPTTPPCDTLRNIGDFADMFPLPPGF